MHIKSDVSQVAVSCECCRINVVQLRLDAARLQTSITAESTNSSITAVNTATVVA